MTHTTYTQGLCGSDVSSIDALGIVHEFTTRSYTFAVMVIGGRIGLYVGGRSASQVEL